MTNTTKLQILRDALTDEHAWLTDQRKAISKGCGSSWDMGQCDERMNLIDAALRLTEGAQDAPQAPSTPLAGVDGIATWRERIVDGAFVSGCGSQFLVPTGASANLAARDAEIADLRTALAHPAPTPTAPAIPKVKDHVLAAVVNNLRDIAIRFHASGQLRSRLQGTLGPLLSGIEPTAEAAGAEVAVKVDRKRVWIVKGVQSFMLDYEADTAEELDWYADRLRDALAGKPAPKASTEHVPVWCDACGTDRAKEFCPRDHGQGCAFVATAYGAQPASTEPAHDCARSHLHEAMDAACEAKTVQARADFKRAGGEYVKRAEDPLIGLRPEWTDPAKRAESDNNPLMDLMAEYWDIAYREGRDGVNLSERANDVMARFRAALGQQQAGVPDGPGCSCEPGDCGAINSRNCRDWMKRGGR